MVQLFKQDKHGRDCHEYRDEEFPWIQYDPVSTIKKNYAPKFESKTVAKSCSENPNSRWFGMSVEDIRQTWDEMATQGRENGTWRHGIKERYFSCPTHEDFSPRDEHEEVMAVSFKMMRDRWSITPENCIIEQPVSLDILDIDGRSVKRLDKMDPNELLLHIQSHPFSQNTDIQKLLDTIADDKDQHWKLKKACTKRGLAGTPDLVVFGKDYFDVHDLKTDKEISSRSYFKKGTREREMLLYPIQHLENCNYEIYCIQLCLYAIMLEIRLGRPFRQGFIHHWNAEKEKLIPIHMADRRQAARLTLQHYYEIGIFERRPKAA